MRKIHLLFYSVLLFFNASLVSAKAIPYNGFFLDTHAPGFFGPWSLYPTGPCGIVTRDYNSNENIYGIFMNSAIGATIGPASVVYTSTLVVRRRLEKWEKGTVYVSGMSCPYMTDMLVLPFTYFNQPLTYYGFKIFSGGLTYYGWVKIENGSYIAYIEDIPGFSIKVGDAVGFQTYPSSFIKLSGIVYRDNNIDGMYNAGDTPLPYQKVSLENSIYTTSTGFDGSYSMMVPGSSFSGSKNVKLELGGRDVYNTPVSGTLAVIFPKYSNVTNLNFGINYNLTTASEERIKIGIRPAAHRRCFKSTVEVVIENKSNATLTDVPVTVEIPTYVEVLTSSPSYESLLSKTASYTIPTLGPYASYTIAISDSIICGNENIRNMSQCYRASINIPFVSSDIFPYYECQDSMHLFKLVNKGNGEMQDSLTYRVFLNNVLQNTYNYKTIVQDTFYIGIPNDGRSLRLEVFQSLDNTRSNMRYIIAEGCGTANVQAQNIGFADQLGSNNDYYSTVSCFTITDSYDPNELIASPTGWGGAAHKIVKEQLITYKIGFQNTGTADAVSIVLVDTLSSTLDLSSFKILYSTHSFKSEITPTPDGRYRLAVTYAGINLPPSSVNEAASHGYIEFALLPKSTTALGTQIKNRAFIYFDFNSYIETNSVLQTVALPDVVSSPVTVRISGGEFNVSDQSLTYGDAPTNPILITNAGSSGLIATSLNTDIVTFESGKLVIHKSGTATLNYKHNGNAKYLPITGVQQRTVTVSRAPLSVQAISKERFIGEANPLLEWSATGFVYNEDESVLQGHPTMNCVADQTSAIADYPITIEAGTLSAENYDISYLAGTLRVVQTTGIQDWTSSGIRVYPIPSRGGEFTVEVSYEKLDRIVLTDMQGRSELYENGKITSQLEGLVLIKIYTDKGVYSGKVELSR